MLTDPEAQMRVRATVHPELVRGVEHRLVAVCRRVEQHQDVASRDLPAADLGIAHGRANHVVHGCDVADDLVDRAGSETQIVRPASALVGILDQRVQPAPDRPAGRLVPGREGDQAIAHGFDRSHRFAVDPRVRDHAREVIGRACPAFLHDLAEVREEIREQALDRRLAISGARQLRVLGAEELVREAQHQRLLLLGDPQDPGEHLQRMDRRDVRDEVALALLAQLVYEAARGLGNGRVQSGDAARCEERAREAPELAMLRWIHVDDRLHLRGVPVAARARLPHVRHTWPVQEQVRAARNLDDVGVARDGPECGPALGLEKL